ncbi:MAG: hypothetical protein HUJ23_05550 [Methylophaga sp.]|jgi:hypothetical protein|nr:hypothetical protein [Methylophaga sp.]MED5510225.1 hypothetical protein [Pseudomonadota bacterium]
MDNISPTLLWEIFKHVRSWLANLNRAGWQRKQQSKQALQNVILAARETAVYLRQFKDTGKPDHRTERHLATLWTKLGFELEELGLDKLAKRCHISGRHWADPEFYDADFLQQADISLQSMEKLAGQILLKLKK